MTRRAVSLALLVAALIGVAPTARADDKGGGSKADAEMTFDQGLAIAQAQVPGGVLIRGRVEGDFIGYYFWLRPEVIEVEVLRDKAVKKVVKKEGPGKVSKDVLDAMEKMTRGKTKLPDGRILEIAAGELKGAGFKSLTYAIQDDRLVAQIGTVQIDAETGKTTAIPADKAAGKPTDAPKK